MISRFHLYELTVNIEAMSTSVQRWLLAVVALCSRNNIAREISAAAPWAVIVRNVRRLCLFYYRASESTIN